MPAPDVDRLNLLLSLRRYSEGEKAAREAIAADPEVGFGHSFLALFLLNQGHHERAIDPARTGVAKAPHDPWAHAVHATILARLRRSAEAHKAIDEALRFDVDYSYAHRVRAQLHCIDRRFGMAIEAARKGLEREPEDEMLLFWYGWAKYMRGDWPDAMELAENGLRLHPQSPHLLNLWACCAQMRAKTGLVWNRVREYRAAGAAFHESLRADPTESAYADNRRNNALECRRLVVPWCVGLAVALLIAVFGVARQITTEDRDTPLLVCSLVILGFAVVLPVQLTLLRIPLILLTAPLGWLGVQSVPVSPFERWLGRLFWVCALAGWVVAAGAIAINRLQ